MGYLERQVRRAGRRWWIGQLTATVPCILGAALLVAWLAVTAPKFWYLGVEGPLWTRSWIAGAILIGLLLGLVWGVLRRPSPLDAAIEIDRRCRLQDRVASAWCVGTGATAAERLVVEDATDHLRQIDLRRNFAIQWTWQLWLPIAAALLIAATSYGWKDVPNKHALTATQQQDATEPVRRSLSDLKSRIAQQRQSADAAGDSTAADAAARVEQQLDQLAQPNQDRRTALVQLNRLSQELADRMQDLQAVARTREQLRQITSTEHGPAAQLAQALKQGDWSQAGEELRRLSERLRDTTLSPGEREQLVRQMRQLAREMERSLAAKRDLQRKQDDLRQRADALTQEGNEGAADQSRAALESLERQLAELERQNPHLAQLEDLSSQLQQSSSQLETDLNDQGSQSLENLARTLDDMQRDLQTLQSLDTMMQDIADAKSSMNCPHCGGAGCEACRQASLAMPVQGQVNDEPGENQGEGLGQGDRPETETATHTQQVRVESELQPGPTTRTQAAAGPNVAGTTRAAIQREMAQAGQTDPDPITHQPLPRRERQQTREYFELLRRTQ